MISFWTNKSKNTFLLPLSFWQSVRGTPSKLKTENENGNSLEIAAEAPVGVYSNGCTNNNNTPLLYTHTRNKNKTVPWLFRMKENENVCAVYGLLLLALLFVWTICLFGVKERAILHSFLFLFLLFHLFLFYFQWKWSWIEEELFNKKVLLCLFRAFSLFSQLKLWSAYKKEGKRVWSYSSKVNKTIIFIISH